MVVNSIEDLQEKCDQINQHQTCTEYYQGDTSQKPDDAAIYKRY